MRRGALRVAALVVAGAAVWIAVARVRGPSGPPASPSAATPEAPAASGAPGRTATYTPGRATLVVRVTAGGAPVAGARVVASDADETFGRPRGWGRTDATGTVRIDALGIGRHVVAVAHPDHMVARRTVVLSRAETRIDVALDRGVTIAGRVVDRSGAPVEDAVVRAIGATASDEHGMRRTAADGAFAIAGLPPGDLRLYVHTGRHRPRWEGPFALPTHGDRREVVVRLDPGARVRGRVVDGGGKGVEGASVGSSDDGSVFVATAPDGSFELGGMGDDPVNVFAVARGFGPAHARGVVPGATDLVLVVRPAARIVGRAVAPPAAGGSRVGLWRWDAHFGRDVCVATASPAGADATFDFGDLAHGDAMLVVEADGADPVRLPVHLDPGATFDAGTVVLVAADAGPAR